MNELRFPDSWPRLDAPNEMEALRRAELARPPAPTPAHLLAPTRCRVLRPIFVRGERVEVDEIIELPKHDAVSLAACGKVSIL